jgi:GTPase SAR1 family protein
VIVFLVDASNRSRFEEAYAELNSILKNDALAQVPVLVLGNKIDRYPNHNQPNQPTTSSSSSPISDRRGLRRIGVAGFGDILDMRDDRLSFSR